MMFHWIRKNGLQTADAADLTQELFVTLFDKLPEFLYDPKRSFRGWLHTVTLNLLRDRHRRETRRPSEHAAVNLENVAVPDAVSVLEEGEYRQHLVSRALLLMRSDFQPSTWQAFWEHGVLRRPAEAGVYGAKFRVLHKLRQELGGLIE